MCDMCERACQRARLSIMRWGFIKKPLFNSSVEPFTDAEPKNNQTDSSRKEKREKTLNFKKRHEQMLSYELQTFIIQ